MNQTSKMRQLTELVSTSVIRPPVPPAAKDRLARLNRDNPSAQRRMTAKQSAESGANHARHHVSRKAQS